MVTEFCGAAGPARQTALFFPRLAPPPALAGPDNNPRKRPAVSLSHAAM